MAVEREFARKLPDLLYVSTYWGYERQLSPDWTEPLAREMKSLLVAATTGRKPHVLADQGRAAFSRASSNRANSLPFANSASKFDLSARSFSI